MGRTCIPPLPRVPSLALWMLALASVFGPVTAQALFVLKAPFSTGFDPSNASSPYFYFQRPDGPANDGVITVSPQVVSVSARPFTATVPPGPQATLDHVKFLSLLKTAYNPSGSQKLVYSLTVDGATFKALANPFPEPYVLNPLDDLRLGSFGLINVDFTNFIVADFLLTNTGVWALYERLPFGGNYKAYTQVKRAASRLNGIQVVLKIIYDKTGGSIKWFVNGLQVLAVTKIGYPSTAPGVRTLFENTGAPQQVSPDGFNSGFGLFTILDFADPNNPFSTKGLVKLVNTTDAYAQPTKWFDDAGLLSNRLWGEGAQISVYSHSVSRIG